MYFSVYTCTVYLIGAYDGIDCTTCGVDDVHIKSTAQHHINYDLYHKKFTTHSKNHITICKLNLNLGSLK